MLIKSDICFNSLVKISANPSLFLFIFRPFHIAIQIKKANLRCCAWDSNPGPRDGKRRRIYWAMAATQTEESLKKSLIICLQPFWKYVEGGNLVNQL